MDPKLLLEALEIEKNGDWDRSHRIVQQYLTPDANWVHAYLHRREGVMWNARYWYERANKPVPDYDLDTEWQELHDHVQKQLD
jgi:hypothetical protein